MDSRSQTRLFGSKKQWRFRLLAVAIFILLVSFAPALQAKVPTGTLVSTQTYGYDGFPRSAYRYDVARRPVLRSSFETCTAIRRPWASRAVTFAIYSKQFTGKERDAETGLDYFLARTVTAKADLNAFGDGLLVSGSAYDGFGARWNRGRTAARGRSRRSSATTRWDGCGRFRTRRHKPPKNSYVENASTARTCGLRVVQ